MRNSLLLALCLVSCPALLLAEDPAPSPAPAPQTAAPAAAPEAVAPAAAPEPAPQCAKMVFNEYCLGGPASALPTTSTAREAKGNVTQMTFPQDTMVTVIDGRIASVLRLLSARGTWIAYRPVEQELRSKYGPPSKDKTYFPKYADDDDSRATSIEVGTGRILMAWDQPEFTVGLVWSKAGMALNYQLKALAAAAEKARDNGY